MKKIKSIYKKRFSNNFYYVNYEVDKPINNISENFDNLSENFDNLSENFNNLSENFNKFDKFNKSEQSNSDEVHLDLIVKYKLTKGRDIDDAEYIIIKQEIDFYYFKSKAFRFTERGGKTKKELEKKLKSIKCNLEIIDKIVSQLIEYGYINDENVAERYKELYTKANKSNNYIKNKLFSKGIDKHIVNDLFVDDNNESELEAATKLITKLINTKQKKLNSLENRQKKLQYLYQNLALKGFGFEIIKKAIRNFDIVDNIVDNIEDNNEK